MPVASTIPQEPSDAAGLVRFALPMLAVALLLLGLVLVPARAVPWPQPARMLAERREEIAFAGLGILAATAISYVLILMTYG